MSFASPESDFASSFQRIDANNDGVITREEMLTGASKFGLNQADASRLFDLLDTNKNGTLDEAEFSHASWKLAISKKMSFASPESDFVAPQENDGYNPSKVMEMLLFPSELSFASAESDFSATPIDMAAASLREEWNTGLSFSSPESDFSAPTAEDIEMSANYTLSYNLSFASPESDFSAPTSEEIQQSRGHVPILSFASPESDFTACSQAEFEAMAESSYKPGLSWSAPESDFVSANTEAAIHAQEKQETSLALAVAPSTEARVITRKDRPFEIFHVNEAWTRLCGFGLDECRGKTLQILQGENTDQHKVKELVESITNHQAVETILRNYNKQGREFTNHLRINPVVDENGDVTHLLGTLREVANHEERRQINHAI
jgi:PAS domain S-box-containing protein